MATIALYWHAYQLTCLHCSSGGSVLGWYRNGHNSPSFEVLTYKRIYTSCRIFSGKTKKVSSCLSYIFCPQQVPHTVRGRPRIFKTNCAGSQGYSKRMRYLLGFITELTTRVLFVSSESPSNATPLALLSSRRGLELFRFVSSALSRVQHHTDTSTLLRGTQRPQRAAYRAAAISFGKCHEAILI